MPRPLHWLLFCRILRTREHKVRSYSWLLFSIARRAGARYLPTTNQPFVHFICVLKVARAGYAYKSKPIIHHIRPICALVQPPYLMDAALRHGRR